MGIEFEVENMTETQSRMSAVTSAITEAVGNGQDETADDLMDEIVKTSPVDTGEYKNSWDKVEQGDTVLIVNDADHAQYLVFPNQRQVGSPKADVPSKGIQHNVRGIIKNNEATLREKVGSRIRGVLNTF